MPSVVDRYRTIALAGVLALAALTPGATGTLGAGTPDGRVASNRLDGVATPGASPRADELGSGTPSPQVKLRAGIPRATNTPAATLTPTPAPTLPPKPRPTPPPPPPPPSGPWPGPGNTGLPAGTVLTPHAGNLTVTQAGTVIDALDISNGCIDIQAPNVTVKRTRIRSSNTCSSQSLIQAGTNPGVVIEDSEIDGLGSALPSAIGASAGMKILRVNIHSVGTGMHIDQDSVTLQDSWIHDIRQMSGSHDDTIYSSGAAHIAIRHNRLENPLNQTSVIILSLWSEPATDWQIDNNLFNGAGYTIYGGAGSTYPVSYIRATNNHFGRQFYPNCGYYGPVIYWSSSAPGNLWSGNIWADTGQSVMP